MFATELRQFRQAKFANGSTIFCLSSAVSKFDAQYEKKIQKYYSHKNHLNPWNRVYDCKKASKYNNTLSDLCCISKPTSLKKEVI